MQIHSVGPLVPQIMNHVAILRKNVGQSESVPRHDVEMLSATKIETPETPVPVEIPLTSDGLRAAGLTIQQSQSESPVTTQRAQFAEALSSFVENLREIIDLEGDKDATFT